MDNSSNKMGNSSEDEELFSLMDIFYIIRKRWFYGAILGVVVAAAFLAVMLNKRPVFEASGSVTVEFNTENVMNITEVVDTKMTFNMLNTYLNTQIERIKARPLMDSVIAKFDDEFIEKLCAPYYDKLKEPSIPAGLAQSVISRNLVVKRGEDDESQVISLNFTHPDAEVAKVVVNTYIDGYIVYKMGLLNVSTVDAANFLKRQVNEMESQLMASEESLQQYRQEHELISVDANQGVIGDRLTRLNDALTDARIRLYEAEPTVNQITEADGAVERLMEISAIGTRDEIGVIYNELRELTRERRVLDGTYLRRHPKIIENEASKNSVSEALTKALRQATRQIQSEYSAIQNEVNTLEGKLKIAEEEVMDQEFSLVEYQRKERAVENQRELLNTINKRYHETNIAKQIEQSNVRILSLAQLPRSPNSLPKVQLTAAALVLICLFVGAVPLGLELLDGRMSSFYDIENYLKKEVFGHAQSIEGKSYTEIAQAVLNEDTELMDSFRSLYSNIRMRSQQDSEKQSYLITSTVPEEGKSMVCCNLGAIISRHRRSVLIVDCDLRLAALHNCFGLSNDHGLIPWYEKSEELPADDFDPLFDTDLGIYKLGNNLFVLRTGGETDKSTEILGDARTAALFKRLKEKFDVVLFDTSPVGLFHDATLISEYVDESIFVSRQHATKKSKVRYAINLLDRTTAPVVGVFFNAVKGSSASLGFGSRDTGHYAHGYEKDLGKYRKHYSSRR